MSIRAMDLTLGSYIKFNGKIWKLTEKMHVKPGKGGAYLQATLKSICGTKLEQRFSSSDVVDQVMIEKKPCQFSYKEKGCVFLTDNTTYESIEVQESSVPKHTWYLLETFAAEDMDIFVEYADDDIINVLLPNSLEVVVESADPVVKGQTAASSYKNATIKNGIKILVPPYIESGEHVIVNLYGEKGIEFVERKHS